MTIQYIAGPFEIGLQSPDPGRKPIGADAAADSVPYPAVVNSAPAPGRAESVFHRDYADRRPLLVDDFAPVTRCDRCVIVLGTVFVAGIYTLVWCFEFIQRAQQALHGVTP